MKLRNGTTLRPRFPRFAFPLFGLGMIALAAPTAHAQVASGVELLSQVPGSGNDCWADVGNLQCCNRLTRRTCCFGIEYKSRL